MRQTVEVQPAAATRRAIEATPAIWAGTTFMITLEASGGQAAGHVQPDPIDRDHPLGDHRSRGQLDSGGRLAELGGTDPAAAVDGHLEGGPDLGVELLDGSRELGGRDPELVRHDVVEPVRPVPQGTHPAERDVVADGTDDLDGSFHVELGPRHDGRVVQLVAGGEPVTKVDHSQHPASLRRWMVGRPDNPAAKIPKSCADGSSRQAVHS